MCAYGTRNVTLQSWKYFLLFIYFVYFQAYTPHSELHDTHHSLTIFWPCIKAATSFPDYCDSSNSWSGLAQCQDRGLDIIATHNRTDVVEQNHYCLIPLLNLQSAWPAEAQWVGNQESFHSLISHMSWRGVLSCSKPRMMSKPSANSRQQKQRYTALPSAAQTLT